MKTCHEIQSKGLTAKLAKFVRFERIADLVHDSMSVLQLQGKHFGKHRSPSSLRYFQNVIAWPPKSFQLIYVYSIPELQ